MPRRRRRSSTSLLIALLLLLAVPAFTALAIVVFVDPNGFKPRIAAAVHAATGRELTLSGPISIGLAWSPMLRAADVHLSNPPGFATSEMARLGQVSAQLALWPLLRGRLEIVRLELADPDVTLETNAAGQSNWHFTPPPRLAASSAPPSPRAAPAEASGAPRFAVGAVGIAGGRLSWRDDRTGASRTATIRQLSASAPGPMAPMSVTADLAVDGHDVALTAETGPLEGLLATAPPAPGWPLQVVARVEGARLAASGTVGQPLDGRLYQLTLDASAPDLAAVGAVLGRALPALRDVSISAKVSDASGVPVVSSLALRAGASDLAGVRPGLMLDRLAISAPGLDQPMQAELEGALSGTKLQIAAALGAPASLILGNAPGGSFPVDIRASAAGATIGAKGAIAAPATLSGLDVAVSARIPDLAALSAVSGQPLPALRDIAFDGRLSDREGGYAAGVALRNLSLASPAGDLAGDLSIAFRPRLAVQGQLSGKHVDLDMLQAALLAAPRPVRTDAPTAPPPQPSPPSPAAPVPARRLISDRAFDLSALGAMDADLRLNLGEVRFGGVSARDLAGRLELSQGRLAFDPFAATLPGGRMDLRLSIDSRDAAAPMALAVSAPGLALKPLLTALGLPDDATGTVEVDADVTAAGRSPHALAATLSGRLGLAMTEGELDNRLLAALVDVLRVAKLPADLLGTGGARTRLRCVALRMDATRGIGTVGALVLDTSRALVQGGGVVNLADETLGLRLRPLLRTGGPGVVVPVRVVGGLARPTVSLDAGGALEGVAAGLSGGLAGIARNPLGALTGAVAGERGGDACGPALAAARGARPAAK